MVRGLASRKGHHRWVESRDTTEMLDRYVRDDGDQMLHHDSKYALQEYWGADGEQVDTVED